MKKRILAALLLLFLAAGCAPVPAEEPQPDPVPAETEEEEVPNARVRATLDRVLAGTEPTYGPFKDADEMFKAILKDK